MFRTPKKPANSTFTMKQRSSSPLESGNLAAGPAQENRDSKVRRSIGEWESGIISDAHIIPPLPSRLSHDKASPKKTVESVSTRDDKKKYQYADRIAEARACLVKAKTSLGSSRNTKTDIKNDVIHCLDRLYSLIKEYEAEKGKSPIVMCDRMDKGGRSGDTSKTEETGLLQKMEEHTLLIKENSEKMERLKTALDEVITQPSGSTNHVVQHGIVELLSEVKELRQASQKNPVVCSEPHEWKAMLDEVRDLRHLTEETGKKVEHLQEITPSYAAVLARPDPRSPTRIQPTHSLIVSSQDEEDTSEDVLGKVRETLDAITSGFQVHRVRKVKNQRVVLSCVDQDETSRMAAKLKTNPHLKVEHAKNKDPLVILKDLLSYNTDDEITTCLKTQNKNLLGDLPADEFRATVRYRRKARNPHENHVVLQVSPRVWQKLTSAGRCHIDMQHVAVQDQSPLVQCTKCLGFGHGRKLCREPVDLCSFCSGPHLKAVCPRYVVGDTPSCRNCKAAKYQDTQHNAFDGDCPVRKKWDALARSSVAYC